MDFLTLVSIVLGLWAIFAVLMAVAWGIEQRTGNAGWVDVSWTAAMGIVGLAGVILFAPDAVGTRELIVATMVAVWALRLAGYIAMRSTTVSDDPRYAKLRQQWGKSAGWYMFWFLQAQAAFSVPMLLSIVLAAWNPAEMLTGSDILAIFLFGVALTGSAIADAQLARFKKTAASCEVCDVGLWAWSRHPNYFFEWLIWLSFAVMAVNLAGAWNWGYLALLGPACMFWLLRYVSGVPPLEDHMVAKYGATYRAYQASTSVFFPFPPSRASRAAAAE